MTREIDIDKIVKVLEISKKDNDMLDVLSEIEKNVKSSFIFYYNLDKEEVYEVL